MKTAEATADLGDGLSVSMWFDDGKGGTEGGLYCEWSPAAPSGKGALTKEQLTRYRACRDGMLGSLPVRVGVIEI